jgi:transcription initiation factor TFIID subunit 13
LQASEVAEHRARLTTEDLVFLVRKDARKYGRVKELLRMNEELKKARRAFETQDVEEE